jgi:hypothetical protein
LKKRTKKLLLISTGIRATALRRMPAEFAKVFCFFFSKKKSLPSSILPPVCARACA